MRTFSRIVKGILLFGLLCIVLTAGSLYVLFTAYRHQITQVATEELKQRYGITLHASRARVSIISDWPNVSVQLRDVAAVGESFPGSGITAGSMAFSMNIRELLNRRIVIRSLVLRDGQIVFTKPTEEEPAAEQTTVSADSSGEHFDFQIRKIRLKNMRMVYRSPLQGQRFDVVFEDDVIRLKQYSDGVEATLSGEAFSNGLTFRAKRGEFLHGAEMQLRLHMHYSTRDNLLCVRPGSRAQVDGQSYDVCALLKFGEEKEINLDVSTRNVTVEQIKQIVNPRIRKTLSHYEVKGPLNGRVTLVAPIGKREEPALIIRAGTERNVVRIGSSRIPYKDVAFRAKIVSVDHSGKKGDISKASVTFEHVSGKVFDFPFTAWVKVTNLQRPYLTVRGKMNINAADINLSVKNEFELQGHAHAYIRYSGYAEKVNREEFLSDRMRLTADLRLMNLRYREKKRPYVYTLNGNARVKGMDVSFDDLKISTAVGDARLKGTAEQFVKYLFGYTNGFRATLIAHSDSINLNPVLMKPKQDRLAAMAVADSAQTGKTAVLPVSAENGQSRIQSHKETLSRFLFDVDLHAKKMVMRRVHAEDAKMRLGYHDDTLEVTSLRLYTCGGRIDAKGEVAGFTRVKADLAVQGLDVNAMFSQFENFGQETILSDNLRGKISLEAKFDSQLDDNMEVIGETMSGEVRLSLKDGQLINFGPIEKLSNFLFKNRDFSRVSFSELNETFQVRGFEMTINELEIGSNILNLYVVNGIYNFKGESHINVLLPWNNLKKRSWDHVPELSGKKAGQAKGVKLNFSGPANKMKVSLGHKDLAILKPSI